MSAPLVPAAPPGVRNLPVRGGPRELRRPLQARLQIAALGMLGFGRLALTAP
ncbi:hypothetical protein ACFCWG_05805 [Streptomyces sp. NPDC056390]|uniref:hypothetical protein n=1 Tax=Streptomyces sp. NPDC056390 TaxID=3345806 RepID=UPI0035DFFE50